MTKPCLDTLRLEVQNRGVQPVARELRVSRGTLASVLGGVAREGSVLLVASRWEELSTPTTRVKSVQP